MGESKPLLASLSYYTGFSVGTGQPRGQTALLGESKNLLAVSCYYTGFSVGSGQSKGSNRLFGWVKESLGRIILYWF